MFATSIRFIHVRYKLFWISPQISIIKRWNRNSELISSEYCPMAHNMPFIHFTVHNYDENDGCENVTQRCFFFFSFINYYFRAIILATITKVFVIFICIVSGVVMYAYYVNCDPLTQGVVTNKDQVNIRVEWRGGSRIL